MIERTDVTQSRYEFWFLRYRRFNKFIPDSNFIMNYDSTKFPYIEKMSN